MVAAFNFFHTSRYKWVLSLGYGIFLFLFLLAFLPFGVDNYDPQHAYTPTFLLEISFFIPVTVIVCLLNEFGIKRFFNNNTGYPFIISWTLWSFISTGAATFTAYNYLGDWHDWQWSSFPGFVLNLSTVFIFPAAGIFFYFRFQTLKKDYDSVLTNLMGGIDEKLMIHFKGEGVKDNISIAVSDFIFAQAQDNYIELHYLKNGTLSKHLIRSSLSALQEQLEQDFLVRCHRSFLINLYNVHSIKGNQKDLKITMAYSDVIIPVSRTYVANTLDRLKQYKRFQ
ncbi:LytR/AlgR family response regulator transcription factor [Robiginitalea sp. IMCC44478]|uniref:LytR/AlgR family response regulator transcription factor n=1 Tax=Robiginitalea sp. IMCC44478 TaxID=3459122 RepID=UPI0040426064